MRPVPGPAFERLLSAAVDPGRRKAAGEEALDQAWELLCQSVKSGNRGRTTDEASRTRPAASRCIPRAHRLVLVSPARGLTPTHGRCIVST